jgi:peptidoglycan/LPS O-acetylase OafA/YrhL
MQLRVSHLRRGELMAATFAVLLLVLLFVLPWFQSSGPGGHHVQTDGWNSLPLLRWLIVVTGVAGLLLAFFQETRRAPALPVVTSVIVSPLALVTTIVLLIRLATSAATPQLGAYLGVTCAAGLALGAFYSMRDEDGWQPGRERPVERVPLHSATRR